MLYINMLWPAIFLYGIFCNAQTLPVNKTLTKPDLSFIKRFYSGCFETKRCFGLPEGCIKNSSCQAAVAVSVVDYEYIFELLAPPPSTQVVTALSFDTKMGDDSVMYCHQNALSSITKHTVLATTGYTLSRKANSNTNAGQIRVLDRSNASGYLYCKIKRFDNIYAGEYTFDLQNTKYHLMVCASTEIQRALLLSRHNVVYGVDEVSTYLVDVQDMTMKSKILYRIHGVLMVIIWVAMAPISIILERYYPSAYTKYQNGIAIVSSFFNGFSFFAIIIGVEGWSDKGTTHGIMGIISLLFFTVQQLFVCAKNEAFTVRKVFTGFVTTILGNVTCILAVNVETAHLPKWSMWALVTLLTITIILNIALTVFTTNLVAPENDHNIYGETPIRIIITNFYITCVVLFTAVFLPFVAFAPIYNYWQ